MKKILVYLLPLISAILMFGSCKKDKDDDSPASNPDYYFRCIIDGANWTADHPSALDTVLAGFPGYIIADTSSIIPLNELGMGIIKADTLGWKLTTAIYVANLGVVYEYKQNSTAQLSVTDDTLNNRVSGTFSFPIVSSSNDTIYVTSGEFKVKY